MTERVQVVVRIRPFIASDPADAELNTIVLDHTHVSVGNNRVFKVDRVYMMEDDTEHIYAESVAPLVARFLRGFNASVLAYGQTGTGKTFTVQAMLPLLLSDVLQEMGVQQPQSQPQHGEPRSSASPPLLHLRYVEVYGDTIRDLLNDTPAAQRDGDAVGKLRLVTTTTTAAGTRAGSPISEDEGDAVAATTATTGCTLVGATVTPIYTMAQVASLIARGDARRATGATNVHEHSSRSHAILSLFHPRLTCRLDVVDLAGSEREKKTGNVGLRFQESIAINTGLLALGNVIRALSRINRAAAAAAKEGAAWPRAPLLQRTQHQPPAQAQQHVPYRGSRLTRLLQDTLGGNSASLFIACVAPDTHNRDETLRTLQYCSLALRVLNDPLQQYERLRHAQSPLGRRRSSTASGAVSPLSLGADSSNGRALSFADGDEEGDGAHGTARTGSPASVQLREWTSAYAALQHQYDEQAELLAAVSAAHTAAKARLALCERELRKDEGIFTQQIRQMQQLVAENQNLRRRLAKATLMPATTAKHAAPSAQHQRRRDTTPSEDGETGTLLAALLAQTQVALDETAAAGGAATAPSSQAPAKTFAPGGAPRPPLSAHSPHRPPTARGGTDAAPYGLLESFDDGVPSRAGVRARAAGGGAIGGGDSAPPTAALLQHHAAMEATSYDGGSGAAGGRATPSAAQEPVQSFIRHILGLHGIQADSDAAVAAHSGSAGGGPGTSMQSSIVKSTATSAATRRPAAASPHEAAARTSSVAADSTTPQPMPMPSLGAETEEASPVLKLAAELLRHQGTNAELRNHVQVLQAELDGKARTEALLRLELQEMKETGTMKAATAPRPPQPPVARTDPNSTVPHGGSAAPARASAMPNKAVNAAAPSTAVVSETQLRRRLAHVEMRLRDMDEEAKRVRALQEQELAKVERDNVNLREQLELLRMGECMSPAEARAVMTHLQHQQTAGAAPGRAESKLLGSTGLKYQTVKAEVEERRRVCEQAEQRLATARARLTELRGGRLDVKRRSRAFEVPAALHAATADTYRSQVHDQLHGLEEQVGREQVRFSDMAKTAKELRLSIDALLINQTGNEKLYRERYDALLAKRREMAYLMEVCNLLCEERQTVVAELQHMKVSVAEESRQYEAAFEELSGVLDENAKSQGAHRAKLEELRRLITQTRGEREALEGNNAAAKAAMERQRRRTAARRTQDDSTVTGSSARNDESGATDFRVDASAEESRPTSGGSADPNQQQIRLLDDYYHKLADIVQSDAIEDITGFLDAAADERYKAFDEMNAIKRDMATLEAEKAALEVELSGGIPARVAAAAAARAMSCVADSVSGAGAGDGTPQEGAGGTAPPVTPTTALAALAGAHTLEALAAVTASAAKSGSGSFLPGASVSPERSARMAGLLDDLGNTRDRVMEEEESQEAGAAVLAQVVAQVREAFCGLGCSVEELRALTGLAGVQLSTLLPCLALVEQRTSEYLLAYALEQQRQQHRLQQQQLFLQASGEWTDAHANAAAAASASTSRSAARAILRRPDLLPRMPHGAVLATLARQPLPRTTDIAAGVSAASIDGRAGATTTVEDLVEERPLSEAEMKRIVEAKRALARS